MFNSQGGVCSKLARLTLLSALLAILGCGDAAERQDESQREAQLFGFGGLAGAGFSSAGDPDVDSLQNEPGYDSRLDSDGDGIHDTGNPDVDSLQNDPSYDHTLDSNNDGIHDRTPCSDCQAGGPPFPNPPQPTCSISMNRRFGTALDDFSVSWNVRNVSRCRWTYDGQSSSAVTTRSCNETFTLPGWVKTPGDHSILIQGVNAQGRVVHSCAVQRFTIGSCSASVNNSIGAPDDLFRVNWTLRGADRDSCTWRMDNGPTVSIANCSDSFVLPDWAKTVGSHQVHFAGRKHGRSIGCSTPTFTIRTATMAPSASQPQACRNEAGAGKYMRRGSSQVYFTNGGNSCKCLRTPASAVVESRRNFCTVVGQLQGPPEHPGECWNPGAATPNC